MGVTAIKVRTKQRKQNIVAIVFLFVFLVNTPLLTDNCTMNGSMLSENG